MITDTHALPAAPPSLVRGRKGQLSVADCIVRVLWGNGRPYSEWPSKTLQQLQAEVSGLAKYSVGASTLRATLYNHPELFIRAEKVLRVRWKLVREIQ
jgi:hypothetical protein